ncbi:pyrroloquinoline quinone biosynthesis protein PqqB [Actinomycetospora termitidis]|uniref:Coenzyme PQQ synthesis protein B n=1 Tax=Actinomycetospora termitidis TaxID=3053470 RepID=A0ABT7M7J9_9PSEU|nr:pyrroloquinoline quinone biosynthesis protein PqqB [Actinomycetospora sp. Odt1-22]MDL5156635.1 pyrroloquinoline quinone biosynthesis protein PqqB [Actinomycetospora sp. Odt1-22]
MKVRVLGSSAGGGLPQWNCSCAGCAGAREGTVEPRTQSSIAVGDGDAWFLVNASPDVRQQLAAGPDLHPGASRRSPVEAILLSDAEIDHTLGLLILREGSGVTVHATAATEATLREGTGFLTTLEAYCPVEVVGVEVGVARALTEHLSYTAFDLPTGKTPRFATSGPAEGRVVGYRFHDHRTGGSVVYAPGVADLAPLEAASRGASVLLVDGTCFHDDELVRLGLGRKTAADMGHVALERSLDRLAELDVPRIVLVHMNNSNPILLPDSDEAPVVGKAGVEIGHDGWELEA